MKRHIQRIIGVLGVTIGLVLVQLCAVQMLSSPQVAAQNSEPPCSAGYKESNGRCVASARNTCNTVPLQANDDCPLLKNYVVPAIKVLSASVGVVVVIMVVWGGLQYTASRDNPQQAAGAKDHIRNALIALLVYIFMLAFLNWVVPGGVI